MGLRGTLQIPPFALSPTGQAVKSRPRQTSQVQPRTPRSSLPPDKPPAPAKPPPAALTQPVAPETTTPAQPSPAKPKGKHKRILILIVGSGLILAGWAAQQGWNPLNQPRSVTASPVESTEPTKLGVTEPEATPTSALPRLDAWSELFRTSPRPE